MSRTPIATIFSSLQGSWRLRRSLNSVLPGFPSGIFEGEATFTPRTPSSENTNAELLYSEAGSLETANGLKMRANRQYIYRYSADEDKISAWFVKEDTKLSNGNEQAEELFHDLEVQTAPDGSGNVTAYAGRGEHLCELDMYWAYYEFRVARVQGEDDNEKPNMNVFGVRYKVKGPNKDYTSDTAYERTWTDTVTLL